ncbi:MAG: hypothetical protein JXA57_10140 [Armatimonadetes bacterium]|nr:hypothetical protein [Armatimonadota bacterium]
MAISSLMHRGVRVATTLGTLVALGLLPLVACTSTTGPGGPVTLFVTNATCDAGGCSPIEIRGFPENQPNTPGGMWAINLGVTNNPAVCITLPGADTFRVTNAGTGKTTLFVWTIDDGIALGTLEPGKPAVAAVPSTGDFVPGTAEGWRIALPGGTAPIPASPCLAVYPD